MTEPRISDIPTIQKNLQDIKNFKALKRMFPFLRPLLKLLKVDVDTIDDVLFQVDELERVIRELAEIPDRFNNLFASRGWIIYDLMNLEIAKAAIQKAEAGDIEGAETDLVNYYEAEEVARKLRTMNGTVAFRPRMLLAQKALIDYREERYHACVPVVLSLLDGLVNDLHEKKRGFFSGEVSLEAWDSVAAHSKGLNVLTGIFQKGRYKTSVERITIPYRNGIVHGMDLGYDNKVVAAKAWAALFATNDWAKKAEQGLLTKPPEEPKPSWKELLQKIRINEENKVLLEQWQPRVIHIGENMPSTGEPEIFEVDTPERKLAEYLGYWKKRNYGYMAKCLSALMGNSRTKLAGRVKEYYYAKQLNSFEFTKIIDIGAAFTEIQMMLTYVESGEAIEKSVQLRLINEDAEGKPVIRGLAGGSWTIINWAIL